MSMSMMMRPVGRTAGARIRCTLGAALCCMLALQHAAPAGVPECEAEAALIYKIAKFVRWPDGSLAGAGGSLKLCIVGADDLGPIIDGLAGQRLQGLVISIERQPADRPAADCQIAFIGRSEAGSLESLLASLSRSPVLTISDIDGFAARGGMVGFSTLDGRVNFQINPGASRRAGLEFGAQLLQFATLVADERGTP